MPFIVILAIGGALLYAVTRGYDKTASEIPKRLPRSKTPYGPFGASERVVILGLPGTGKTTLAAFLVSTADRVLAFDPFHDYARFGFKEVSTEELLDSAEMLEESRFRIAVIPNEDTLAEDLESVIALARAVGNMTVLLDEVGDYQRETYHILTKLARNGRHNGIVPVFVSQVAVDIPLTVRRLSTRVYSFMQLHKGDLDALEERCGEVFMAEARTRWPKGEYVEWKLPTFAHDSRLSSQASTRPRSGPSSSSARQSSG